MRTLFTVLLVAFVSSTIWSQEIIEEKYYKNRYGGPEVEKKKGKFVESTILLGDRMTCFELKSIKSQEVISNKCFKDGIPYGKWVLSHGEIINYEFDLPYIENKYDSIYEYDISVNKLKSEIIGNFEPPNFLGYEENFIKYIAMNLIYPEPARADGIQGRVFTQFIINGNGEIINLSILKTAYKILDKEAARVIFESPKWSPAKLDGKPIDVLIVLPINFQLN